jgi:hypothetical protein
MRHLMVLLLELSVPRRLQQQQQRLRQCEQHQLLQQQPLVGLQQRDAAAAAEALWQQLRQQGLLQLAGKLPMDRALTISSRGQLQERQ